MCVAFDACVEAMYDFSHEIASEAAGTFRQDGWIEVEEGF